MLLKEILEIYELIDHPGKPGRGIVALLKQSGAKKVVLKEIKEKKGSTEFIKVVIPGKKGKISGGKAPTLGVIGRLGGVGARPEMIGLVSDGDGAFCALSIALKLTRMAKKGDALDGDIILATHVCTNAPTTPHEPVPFMGSPVELATMNAFEVDQEMEAILSIDTSRGNRIINHAGFAISPTAKEGYILRISEDLLSLMEQTTGKLPATFPITIQDITPYGNELYHFNSIMQPTVATGAPVVGVALTAEVPVAGCATGVSNVTSIDAVGRFVIEVAQRFGKGTCLFYDKDEYKKMVELYGNLKHLQTNPLSKKK